jgi:2-oxoglutarate dehydrogenase E2 component (dihydrolipoamide succinyltransferase)
MDSFHRIFREGLLPGLFKCTDIGSANRRSGGLRDRKIRVCGCGRGAFADNNAHNFTMSLEVKIPAVGESITSGMISAWHKNDGDSVAKGDALFTLETDKVSTEVGAEIAGVLSIKAQAGAEVQIGETVATIDAAGAAASPAPKTEAPKAAAPKAEKKPAVKAPEPAAASPALVAAPVSISAAVDSANAALATISENVAPVTDGRTTRKRLSPLRRKIAAQLVMAQHTAAILTTFNEVDMSAVMKMRKDLGEAFAAQHGVKLGFMSFFIKATVAALEAVPQINVRVDGDDIVQNHFYDVGVAVGTERGLVVPVIRGAKDKSFADIERDLAAYAVKAREGKITIEDLQGGVFTISNGGIYGSLLSTPILNPPQSGILGMHKIQERPMAEKGQVVIRPMMYLAMSYDHRVVDGKEAVTFLVKIKESLEQPQRLLLGL